MRGSQQKRFIAVLVLIPCFFVGLAQIVSAQCATGVQSCSSTYQVDQTFFGSGGVQEACSSLFCSRQSLGEIAIGETNSNLYRAYAGFNTTDEPFLELSVSVQDIDLGVIETDEPGIGVGQFYVRAWQASGYVIHTASDPPKNGSGQQISPMTVPDISQPGTEQFGINLVENTGIADSADPEQVPDNTFSFGQVAPGYDTDSQFKYVKGDIIASSSQSSSVTIYKVTYLFNISDTTPSGRYVFPHILVATATY